MMNDSGDKHSGHLYFITQMSIICRSLAIFFMKPIFKINGTKYDKNQIGKSKFNIMILLHNYLAKGCQCNFIAKIRNVTLNLYIITVTILI